MAKIKLNIEGKHLTLPIEYYAHVIDTDELFEVLAYFKEYNIEITDVTVA